MSAETYTFLATSWDVGKAKEMIERGEILATGKLPMEQARGLLGLHRVDEDHANTLTEADLEVPVILARQTTWDDGKSQEFTMLIDGWHRVWKASVLDYEHIPAVMIDGEKVIKRPDLYCSSCDSLCDPSELRQGVCDTCHDKGFGPEGTEATS